MSEASTLEVFHELFDDAKQQAVPKPVGKSVYTTSIATGECTQHYPGGEVETVALQAGSEQLLIGRFSNGTYQTELPNLLLMVARGLAPQKKPAACKKPAAAVGAIPAAPADPAPAIPAAKKVAIKKKPAAAPAAAAAAHPAEPADAPAVRNYQVLWYKNGHNIGIRQCFGEKKQIFSAGGQNCKKTEAQLRAIGNVAIDDLAAGMPPAEVKEKTRASAIAA